MASLSLANAGCRGASASEQSTGKAYPREQTLFIGGRQWGEPSSINPLSSSPDWPVISGVKLMYETLFFYDPMSGKMVPLLAESYVQRADEIEVTLQEKARWNDGKPVTAWDVKYTFDLGKKHKDIPISPTWTYLDDIKLPEVPEGTPEGTGQPRKLVFVLNKEHKNPLIILDAFEEFRIVPRHVIEPLLASVKSDMNEFLKLKFHDPKQAVCSGPYKIDSIQSEKIGIVRDDNYWGNDVLYAGKKPAPKYIVHPIYKSNDHFSVALQQGKLDVSSSYIPRISAQAAQGRRHLVQGRTLLPLGRDSVVVHQLAAQAPERRAHPPRHGLRHQLQRHP
ncbi:MAG: ABC transporter substrate-binding protein [Polyangiaceae bacterium]